MQGVRRFSSWVGQTFALWAVVFAILGFSLPQVFVPLKGHIPYMLGIIMFGMGLTLRAEDFMEIVRRPWQILLGVVAQFLIMPLLAFLLIQVFTLPSMVAVGVILVGCCPGGTSSNVITYLARGDVALSVTVTACSTLLSPFLTPLLLQLYAHETVDIEVLSMMLTIMETVLLPIVLGVIINRLFSRHLQLLRDALPLVSVTGIVLILATVVALSKGKIAESGLLIFAVVMLHNLLGYLLGWVAVRAVGLDSAQRRAIMVEVGMQNSGLGATLGAKYFTPEAALPSAIFSVWHNISGALVANVCTWWDKRKAKL
ncbi:MAG: bile acid:sodium symporter family protein [Cardiobacteriaceae bacterium]|nr:bile acid:sodium symporter family protein [Cardiobacteriaceae bacterium]